MEFSLVHMWESMGYVAKSVVYVLLFMSVATSPVPMAFPSIRTGEVGPLTRRLYDLLRNQAMAGEAGII